MKTITLKVEIQVPDDYEPENSYRLLEDAVFTEFKYTVEEYEKE